MEVNHRLRPQKYGGFTMKDHMRGFAALRSLTALALVICLLVSAVPTVFAASSVASSANGLYESSTKHYIKLSKSVLFFTGEKYGNGSLVQPAIGTVCQLVSDNWYTPSDGLNYYGVYYNNQRYNVLRTDVMNDIMTAEELQAYITGTLWKQSVYATLRESMDLVGDVRVHAVQLALQRLGYYTGALDGKYGSGTAAAVKKFQKAQGLGSDGSAGPLTQPVLFALASGSSVISGTTSSSTTTTIPSAGTLTTIASVNLRKNASTSSARLAIVPRSAKLNYTDTTVKNGVTWFKVEYAGMDGWLMGTYVSASGNSTSPSIGTVTITKASTRVRKTANGTKTGYVLSKGTTVDMISQPVTAGNYIWYNIRTSSGLVGFVRGDCAKLNTTSSGGTSSGGTSSGGSSSGSTSGGTSTISPTTGTTFIKLPATTKLFTSATKPSSGGVNVSAGTVLMLAGNDTYTEGGATYCSLYYNNKKYNAMYSEVSGGIMNSAELSAHVNTLLSNSLGSSLKRNLNLVGDIRVYALQIALYNLGYYTGSLDGTYGSGTQSAVRNFQRAAKITVDGSCGAKTWTALQTALGGGSSSGGSSGGSTGGITVTNFGTVNKVVKGTWDYGDNGGDLFPKSTYATVMDIETGKVFRIYRWSGASHADCVPASLNDTKTMCEIVGYNFNGTHPNSTQLSKIKADETNSNANYTWPDFNGNMGGKDIGSKWDRRPALLNVNGTVYPVSIYGYPHGFNGTDSFSQSKFPGGGYFYSTNCYYGMMCVHFVDSKTHTATSPDSGHQASITKAWQYAQSQWPSLFK